MTTMATSTLSVPTADDTMEISSDAGRADQDIDIDFMGSEHGDNDVDWMLHDAASERGDPQAEAAPSNNDDLMYDDGEELTYVEEDVMQDDAPEYTEAQAETADLDIDFDPHPATEETLYDIDAQREQEQTQAEEETLVDFTFDEHTDAQVGEELPLQTQNATTTVPLAQDSYVGATQATAEDANVQIPAESEEAAITWDDDALDRESAAAHQAELEHAQEEAEKSYDADVQEELHEEVPEALQEPTEADTSRHDSPALQHTAKSADPSQVDLAAHDAAAAAADQVPALTTGLHPVKVTWIPSDDETLNLTYSLFQTSTDDDPNSYFLKDSSVASSTLTDLFRACRSVLDQQLSDDVELELYCHELQLTISEDSAQCHSNSLAQILEVYVTLSHNDGTEDVPPFTMDLYAKDRLSSRLTQLFQAASEKTGLSYLFHDDSEQGVEQGGEYQPGEGYYEGREEQGQGTFETLPVDEPVLKEGVDEEATSASRPEVVANEQKEEETAVVEETQHQFDDALHEDDSYQQHDFYEEGGTDHTREEPEQDYGQNEEAEEDVYPDFVGRTEEGGGGSSGSSTVQGETQPEPSRGYPPPDDDDEWLIDYSEEENNFDALENADRPEQRAEYGEEEIVEETQVYDTADTAAEQTNKGEYDAGEEQPAESYDENSFPEADTFNQEFDPNADHYEEVEVQEEYEDDQEQIDQTDGQNDWDYDDAQYAQVDAATTQESGTGTFQVPSSTEDNEDEDEITFNDDEFTVNDEHTQDAAVQDHTTDSPLGKRGRDEEDNGAVDGSDQESKRLKAA